MVNGNKKWFLIIVKFSANLNLLLCSGKAMHKILTLLSLEQLIQKKRKLRTGSKENYLTK